MPITLGNEVFFPENEVCDMLDISRSVTAGWRKRGTGPVCLQPGGEKSTYLYPWPKIEAWFQEIITSHEDATEKEGV